MLGNEERIGNMKLFNALKGCDLQSIFDFQKIQR